MIAIALAALVAVTAVAWGGFVVGFVGGTFSVEDERFVADKGFMVDVDAKFGGKLHKGKCVWRAAGEGVVI